MWSTCAGHSAPPETLAACERITYPPTTLREINHTIGARPRLPDPLFKLLQECNISQIKPRGIRAGKDKRDLVDKPIASIVNNSAAQDLNRSHGSVSRNNLVVIKPTQQCVKACVLNCRSVKNKACAIVDHIIDSDLDIIALTETWLSTLERDQRIIGELTPPGYIFHHVPRLNRKGGGVAVLCKDTFKIHVNSAFSASSFECIDVSVTAISVTIKMIVIYRIPPNSKNGLKRSEFIAEFTNLLEKTSIEPGKLLILGDFNVNWDNKNSQETKELESLLNSYNLEQHVHESTHKDGHVIDWVISRPLDDLVKSCEVNSMISDHHAIHIDLSCSKLHPPRKSFTFRNIKGIDTDKFKADILKSDLYTAPAKDIDEKVKQYSDVLKSLLDLHAPEKSKKVAIRERRPWMTEKIANAKKRRRRFERKWRKSKLTVHREIYEQERDAVKEMIQSEKSHYYNEKVEECEGDQKKLFSIVDKLLNKNQPSAMPQHDSVESLVNSFSDFFQGKIETIRSTLSDLEATAEPLTCPPIPELLPPSKNQMNSFELATEDEILKIIKSSSKASCELDPIPTRLLTDHFLPELLPVITEMVNASLASGIFPASLKTALVRPLLKKLSLDSNVLKNFRPVSNLSFLSKIIEKIAARRLFTHMTENGIHDIMQSAYKPFHSTETALLRVQNDILSALDNKSGVYLALIDLSAAFDTVDHNILLDFMKDTVGINGDAWNWFQSYLTGRTQQVSVENVVSELAKLLYGVPQGSVMGPIKYCIYTLNIGAII
jgi:exonuclease III